MPVVKRSRPARADLDGIWLHIAQHSQAAADRLLNRLYARMDQLSVLPKMGEVVRPGVRKIVSPPYVVFYRVSRSEVTVLRVVHGKRHLGGMRFA